MATITIRNLDEKVKRKLQVRAALHGRSMEAEARDVLTMLVNDEPSPRQENLGTAIRRRFARFGDVNLQIPPRQSSSRPIPSFD
jgi:plasmid stability protein